MDISIPYYEDNSRVSNSAIGWFIKRGPRYFRDMLDGKEEGMNLRQSWIIIWEKKFVK